MKLVIRARNRMLPRSKIPISSKIDKSKSILPYRPSLHSRYPQRQVTPNSALILIDTSHPSVHLLNAIIHGIILKSNQNHRPGVTQTLTDRTLRGEYPIFWVSIDQFHYKINYINKGI